MTFMALTPEQLETKHKFITNYIQAHNAADGSKFDANANVTNKNVATLEIEMLKDVVLQINRSKISSIIAEMYGDVLATEYARQISEHEIYVHDETSMRPYCASISLYPFVLNGVKDLGIRPPKNIDSFCGAFLNLMFAVSSQFAGAVATVEFLMYFDHFARKEYGDDYLVTHSKKVNRLFKQVVNTINTPASARGYQSVFWNISLYDEHYFDSMFGTFVFPDGTQPEYGSLAKLQEYFLEWFRITRERDLHTFPVVTAAVLTEAGKPKDKAFAEMCSSQMAKGNSFFVYMSDSADSLASCCRLRNEITDNAFSYSLGAGGVSTGSLNVITLNINRMVQDGRDIADEIDKIHKYQLAHYKHIKEMLDSGHLPYYDEGFITISKQFMTIGINGLVEAAEFKGITVSDNESYSEFVNGILAPIYHANKRIKKDTGIMFNTEFVPAENLGPKNAAWDKKDGYVVKRDCYNSYFYVVEDEMNVIDKFKMHGNTYTQFLDGGSALHLNLDHKLTKEGYLRIFDLAASTGCNYWCVNVQMTICNECGDICTDTNDHCVKCGSIDIDFATRIIGYLKRISNFGLERRKEAALRHYHE